jgi:hypothetical protein
MRHLKALALMLVLSAILGPAALAANAHFIGTPTASVSGNTLTVSFRAAGLGNVASADFSLGGTVRVDSRCYTKKGNTPQAANKQETINVDQTATFPVSNGQTRGSFTVTPLSTLSCPNGQNAVIESVSYSGLTISGQGISYSF